MKLKVEKTAQEPQQRGLNLQRKIIFLNDLKSLRWNSVSCNALSKM